MWWCLFSACCLSEGSETNGKTAENSRGRMRLGFESNFVAITSCVTFGIVNMCPSFVEVGSSPISKEHAQLFFPPWLKILLFRLMYLSTVVIALLYGIPSVAIILLLY